VTEQPQAGFTLAEVLVAMLILATALASLAQLFGVGMRTNMSAHRVTITSMLAAQKVEELAALAWGVDERGRPIGGLPATLSDTEHLDAAGNVVGRGSSPPDSTTYVRQWWVSPLPSSGGATLVFEVFARRVGERGGTWVVAAKTRKAR
jgi:prepilin-type N-terminal cleavage/methylation domain-containing protein